MCVSDYVHVCVLSDYVHVCVLSDYVQVQVCVLSDYLNTFDQLGFSSPYQGYQ